MRQNNKIVLTGRIVEVPKFSYESFGESVYELKLRIKRLSETCDELIVSLSDRICNISNLLNDTCIDVSGEIRTHNRIIDNKSCLIIRTYAHKIHQIENITERKDINANHVELDGYICKKPIYRITPSDREVCDILIACNRNYNRTDYIPAIAWGRNARFVGDLSIGDRIALDGRLQSREYPKIIDGQETKKTAYEVSVNNITLCK